MAGKARLRPFTIKISQPPRIQRRGGRGRPAFQDPFVPADLRQPFHFGGNSFCYGVQLAHLMGAGRIICLGFTHRSKTGYEHGDTNPVTRRQNSYSEDHVERVLHWSRWYEETFPGKVLLDKQWHGPLNEVFGMIDHG